MIALAELLLGARPFRIALSSEFRGVREREGLVLFGPEGTGEFAPFLEYDARACARWLAAAVEQAFVPPVPPVRSKLLANAIVPAGKPHHAAEFARRIRSETGCTIFKIKVGDEDGIARVRAVAAAVPGCSLRLDANAAWDVTTACATLAALAELPIDYVEQPCRTLADCAAVRAAAKVRVAVDEGVRLAQTVDCDAVRRSADVAILKPTPRGGVRAALALAERLAMPVTVSSALDSSIGLYSALALAAALPEPPLPSGLGTGTLLGTDLVRDTVVPRGGCVPFARPELDDEALARAEAAMPLERRRWWLERLAAAWDAGGRELARRLA